MKIWNGYGSEHSMNLVLIGRFKQAEDAEQAEENIRKLSDQAGIDESHLSVCDPDPKGLKFSDEMLSLLKSLNLLTLGVDEPGQLLLDYHLERKAERITIKTDEVDISAFMKIFIQLGARVEVFSADYYPLGPADSD